MNPSRSATQAVTECSPRMEDNFGKVDVLVNNATISSKRALI